jgi:hypothetical protein
MHDLLRRDTNVMTAHRQLLVFQDIGSKTQIKSPANWNASRFMSRECQAFRRMVDLASRAEFAGVLECIQHEFEKYETGEKDMAAERGAVQRAKAKAQHQQELWFERRAKQSDSQLGVRLEGLRRDTETELADLLGARRGSERRLSEAIARVTAAADFLGTMSVVPQDFEAVLGALREKKAKRDWLDARLRHELKKHDEIEQKVNAEKKKCEDVTKEIGELKVRFEELKVKSQTSEPIEVQLDERYQELHDAYYCQLCKERVRDTFIIECRHSYCENCVKECVRNRNRKCPYCSVPFDPVHGVITIKW